MRRREDSGGDTYLLAQHRSRRGVQVGLLLLAVFALCGCAARQAPWFGRDKNLPRAPVSVVTGPVDWQQGIPEVLSIGMSQAEVEKRLGKPLVEAIPHEKALEQGLDPEDVSDYFYGGVFAWVLYDASGKVLTIEFDLKSLKERMEIEQSLLLSVRGKYFLVSRQTSYEEMVRWVQSVGQTTVERQPYAVVVRFKQGGVFSAGFDAEKRLESITIIL